MDMPNQQTAENGEKKPLSLGDVLVAEYRHQGLEPRLSKEESDKWTSLVEEQFKTVEDERERKRLAGLEFVGRFYQWLHKNNVKRSALCFSGGGIRSATFGLGVLQGFARWGILDQFDYLSTVSGGGYLGSWLSAWTRRTDLESVVKELASPPESPLDPEPEAIRHLRAYSNYMSPQMGLLSADTWTLIGIYLRNLLLNWLVLIPLIAAVLMIPRICVSVVRQCPPGWLLDLAFGVGTAAGVLAIAYMLANLPSRLGLQRKHSPFNWKERERRNRSSQGWFLLYCWIPMLVLAVLVTTYWAWPPRHEVKWIDFVFFALFLTVAGYAVSSIWVRGTALGLPLLLKILVCDLAGAIILWLIARDWYPPSAAAPQDGAAIQSTTLYACFAAPLFLLVFLFAATLFVGLMSRVLSDADREWFARAGGWMLIAAAVWCVVSVLVLFGPIALEGIWAKFSVSLGGVSGLTTLLLGRSADTPARGEPKSEAAMGSMVRKIAIAIAAPVFATFVLIVISLGTGLLVKVCSDAFLTVNWMDAFSLEYDGWGLMNIAYCSPLPMLLILTAAFVIIGVAMGCFVNINKFSLHGAYRDRLIRAYVGASCPDSQRKPNPFTGFDEADDIQMCELQESKSHKLFHIINMALNLVGGRNLAWQQRKAESFTASALHCGSLRLGYRGSQKYGHDKGMNRAISLGTAAAISGAAASPNMGYHSSPLVAFLLTLFNVRLGWWLGNPGEAGKKTFDKAGPSLAPVPLFQEAFGLTDDQNPYVYLSDGGHFENLGLYEMVLRRCRHIVVVDAGEDRNFTFEDLANAISKIRVDLGIPIEFGQIAMLPRTKRGRGKSYDSRAKAARGLHYCAIGRIHYSSADGRAGSDGNIADGLLLYIKPSLTGSEPVDVYNYAKSNPDFPHQTTADQFFSESQFESYRALGRHAAEDICKDLAPPADLEDFFTQIETSLCATPNM